MMLEPGQVLPQYGTELEGTVKVALLLMSLDEQSASSLLGQLPAELVQELTGIMDTIDVVPVGLAGEVIEEYYSLQCAQCTDPGSGLDQGGMSTQEAKPEARIPFSFLRHVECDTLLAFIQDEHPQTIALIASYLDQEQASDLFISLPADKQVDVVRRVANMQQTNLDLVWEVEAGLEDRMADMLTSSPGRAGGVKAVAQALNLCDRNAERNIMNSMEADSPELAENIRRLMFEFEDIRFINDRGIQAVLMEIDNDQLAVSLKTASDDLHEKIFSNMSERAAAVIREDMNYLGPIRLSEVETAQQNIIDVVRRLEDAGQLIINGRPGDSEVVV